MLPLWNHRLHRSRMSRRMRRNRLVRLEMHQEYGLELEVLAASESDESPDAPESLEDESAAQAWLKAPWRRLRTPDAEIPQESEPEAVAEPLRGAAGRVLENLPSRKNGFYPLVRNARGNWRPGKGFSRSELEEAGLSLAEAARLHIRVDKRRRNAHPMNVDSRKSEKRRLKGSTGAVKGSLYRRSRRRPCLHGRGAIARRRHLPSTARERTKSLSPYH